MMKTRDQPRKDYTFSKPEVRKRVKVDVTAMPSRQCEVRVWNRQPLPEHRHGGVGVQVHIYLG